MLFQSISVLFQSFYLSVRQRRGILEVRITEVWLYIYTGYNIYSAWFLDIVILTCLRLQGRGTIAPKSPSLNLPLIKQNLHSNGFFCTSQDEHTGKCNSTDGKNKSVKWNADHQTHLTVYFTVYIVPYKMKYWREYYLAKQLHCIEAIWQNKYWWFR